MLKFLKKNSYISIGLMLFALFFGAGNLIFPAFLGQNAGSNLPVAMTGFIIMGVGLPLLGVLVMGYSGAVDLLELSSRAGKVFGVTFTTLLYLTIGPFFAIPRTGRLVALAEENREMELSILHTNAPEKAEDFKKQLEAQGISVSTVVSLCAVIATHLGEGALVLGITPKFTK